jgi:tripartite-type tricarboxylate transporter receptor subunit TctC
VIEEKIMTPWIRIMLAVLVLPGSAALAQSYPARAVTWVAAMAPGGATDTVSRELSAKVAERWGQPVVVDSLPGASGVVAAQKVKIAAPNGLSLLVATNSLLANQVLTRKPEFDVRKDFIAVARWFEAPYGIYINPALPVHTLAELIAYAKANPGKLNYASTGVGSGTHLVAEELKMKTGVQLFQINYKGGSPAILDVVAGRCQVTFLGATAPWQQLVEAGKLRVLAITSSQRLATIPNVPTAEEAGLPGFTQTSWVGLFAPAETPASITGKINADLRAVLNEPELRKRYLSEHRTLPSMSVEETQKKVVEEIALLTKLVDSAGIERQ